MDNLLLDLALLTVRAYSSIVGAVLLTIPLEVDRSYVNGGLAAGHNGGIGRILIGIIVIVAVVVLVS
jgi:hypothetical protein